MRMVVVTEQLKEIFMENPLYSKDGQGKKAIVIARFYLPFTDACWLITEAEPCNDDDWLLFGYCHILEWEFGYVLLSEIQQLNVEGITVELDLYLPENQSIQDCLNSLSFSK